MTFRFRAAPLLALRQRQLDAAQARLVRANDDLATADGLLDAAEQASAGADAAYRKALAEGADHASLERHRTWISRQCAQADVRRQAREECRAVAAAASGVVLAAHRQVKVLERLRDRARQRHQADVNRREMQDIDQLATLQFARRMTEGEAT